MLEFCDLEKITEYEAIKKEIKNALCSLVPNKRESILIVGLGNREITCDNIGPLTVSKLLATRHIKKELAEKIGLGEIKKVSVLETGVLGNTGMESAEITEAVVKKTKPDAVIVIDALAAGSLSRLYKTIQFCNTGISPGSGVKNSREEISEKSLLVPVIAIGIPTVVEASVIARELTKKEDIIPTELILTPKECDSKSKQITDILASALNEFLQPSIDSQVISQLV